jgi:hypothetical protein
VRIIDGILREVRADDDPPGAGTTGGDRR